MKKQRITVIFLILLSFLFFSTAQAKEPAVVVVNGGGGETGEILHTSIELTNINSLERKGISGGELVLAFDAERVDVEEIKKGPLIGNNFLFIANSTFTENSIKVVWAALGGLIQEDGVLLNVSFKFKESGSIDPKITDMILYDENVQLLHIDIKYNQDDSGEGEPVDITARAPSAESPGRKGSTGANNDSGNSEGKGGEEPQIQAPENVSEERGQTELAGALNNRERNFASITAIIVAFFLAAVIGGTSYHYFRNFKHSQ